MKKTTGFLFSFLEIVCVNQIKMFFLDFSSDDEKVTYNFVEQPSETKNIAQKRKQPAEVHHNLSNNSSISSVEGILFLNMHNLLFAKKNIFTESKRSKHDTDSGSEFLNQFLGFVNKPATNRPAAFSGPPKVVKVENRTQNLKTETDEDSDEYTSSFQTSKPTPNTKIEVKDKPILKPITFKKIETPKLELPSESEEDYDSDENYDDDEFDDIQTDDQNDDGKITKHKLCIIYNFFFFF